MSRLIQALERILYVWAIQHPESGYVQGINDLVTPFFQVFLSAYIGMLSVYYIDKDTDPETFDPGTLPAEVLASLEADSFWCLSALLDGIQVINFLDCVDARIITYLRNRESKEWSPLFGNWSLASIHHYRNISVMKE